MKPRIDKKRLEQLRLANPRAALLYEKSGKLGPWSSAEFAAAFPPVPIERPPMPPMPDDVAALRAAYDEALVAFEVAHQNWSAAMSEGERLRRAPLRLDSRTGTVSTPGAAQLRNLEAECSELWKGREKAAEAVSTAKRPFRAADQAWRRSLRIDGS